MALVAALGVGACASENPDPDGDGVSAADDRCPNSDPNLPSDEEGCTNADDTDGDGVPNDQDLCPETNEEAIATADGCGEDQVDEDGNPLEEPADFRTFIVDALSETPMVFRAKSNTVIDTPSGTHIEGTLLVSTPVGHLKMAEASVDLDLVPGTSDEVDRIVGSAGIPFPSVGAMSACEMDEVARANLGLDYGSNLEELGAPLALDRRYLFFQFNAGLAAQCGPISIEAPGGVSALAVLDPSDPMMYLEGSLLGLGAIGPIDNVGLGISAQGLMPFTPTHVLTEVEGLEGLGDFDGHIFIKGSGSVYNSLSIDGEMMLSFNEDGGSTETLGQSLQIGANGAVGVSVDFLELMNFGFGLGDATVVAHGSADENYAYVAGELAPETDWLPEFVPVVPEVFVRVEGLISDDVASSFLSAKGLYKMDLSPLGNQLGIELNALQSVEGSLDVNRDVGIEFHGIANRSFSPLVEISQNMEVHGRFGSSDNWFIEMRGGMSVGGASLSGDAVMRLSQDGLAIRGAIDTGIASIIVEGDIGPGGVILRGQAGVEIDLVAGKNVVNTVVDGALCGYQVVQDGAICGFETVKSAAICGTSTITSAAVCGTSTITSAATCGVETFSCWINPLKWGTCSKAKSCTKVNSCQVANTCQNLNAPKTCTDFNQPLSCEQHSILPDFDFGDFVGNVDLEVGTSGIRGTVSGDYCVEGNCASLFDGSLRVGTIMEACIDISIGHFCARI